MIAPPQVREALKSHIQTILFTDHPYGKQFRERVLGWRPKDTWQTIKQQMLTEAQTWDGSPTKLGLTTVFTGRLYKLYTEVELDEKGNVTRILIEID